MLKKEFYNKGLNGVNLYRTYSDENKFIRKVGTNEFYIDAIDVENTPDEYIETNETILSIEEEIKHLEEINK